VAVVANGVITPIAVIGLRVDLAVNDPVELPGKRGLLGDDVHAEGSDAEDDPPAATSLALLNVTLKPTKDDSRVAQLARPYNPEAERRDEREQTND
jgi:hypothetical protein